MRIVQIANFVHPTSGGLATAIAALRNEYQEMGHDVVELLPRTGIETFDNAHAGRRPLASMSLPRSGGYRVVVRRAEVRHLLEELRPDMVELSDKTTLSWVPEWCRRHGIPTVLLSHERLDMLGDRVSGRVVGRVVTLLVDAARRRLATNADVIVCASTFAAQEFQGSKRDVKVVPLGVDTRVFRPGPHRGDWGSPLHLGICSRLSPEKGVDVAVEAFVRLQSKVPSRLTVLGDGPLRTELAARTRGMNVEFLGHVNNREEVARMLSGWDITLNMGAVETFGLVTLESLACGTPVVVASQGGSIDLVTPQVGGVSDAEPEALVREIVRMTGCSRPEMSSAAVRFARDYTWTRTASTILDFIDFHIKTHLMTG